MALPGQLGLPAELADLVGDQPRHPVTIGRSGATTTRIERPEGDWFVKVQLLDPLGTSLQGEAERLRWLAPHLPVPEVVASGTDGNTEWLVTSALAGSDATDPIHGVDPEHLLRTLAEGLRRIHDIVPVADCPFDARIATDLDRAQARVEAGRVDASDFGTLYQGMTAPELYELMLRSGRPDVEDDPTDLVVLHGDYCVPNVVIDRGHITGYVDVGRCGVGDRHRDLGIALRSIAQNFGAHAAGFFLDSYGNPLADGTRVKLGRLDFYVMLDEFF